MSVNMIRIRLDGHLSVIGAHLNYSSAKIYSL
jgi:hypothetical protein